LITSKQLIAAISAPCGEALSLFELAVRARLDALDSG
jgi:hypothetical protein